MSGSAASYLAIDGDGHVIEGEELFREYLPPPFRDGAPGPMLTAAGVRRFIFAGGEHPPFPPEISIRKPMAASDRLKVLEKERIWAAMLFPSGVLVGLYALPPAAARALAEAYLDWIADYCAAAPRRLFFAAPVPLDDIPWAAQHVARAVARGARAICIRPNRAAGRRWDEAALDPFYAAVQEAGVPLVFHETTGDPHTAGGERYGMERPEHYAFNHVISHPFEQMFAALSVLCGGVLERFQHLRVGFAEAGCGWVPYWLARLDAHFAQRALRHQMPIRLKPSEYFARQCFVTCDPDDETVRLALAGIGGDTILFATDYPHFDSAGGAVGAFLAIPGVAPADQRKLLWDNAARLFNIAPPPALADNRHAAS
jgi:uncharacterized protein